MRCELFGRKVFLVLSSFACAIQFSFKLKTILLSLRLETSGRLRVRHWPDLVAGIFLMSIKVLNVEGLARLTFDLAYQVSYLSFTYLCLFTDILYTFQVTVLEVALAFFWLWWGLSWSTNLSSSTRPRSSTRTASRWETELVSSAAWCRNFQFAWGSVMVCSVA